MTFLGPDDIVHDMPVLARTMRGDGTGKVDWTDWRPDRLHVQLREGKSAAKYGVAVLALKTCVWAEYSSFDFDKASGTWLVEDYYLQLRKPE